MIPNFAKAFRDGTIFLDPHIGEMKMECRAIGKLAVTTGKIVACDPLVNAGSQPFQGKVPAGRYPVVISIAHVSYIDKKGKKRKGKPDQRIAFAKVCLSRRAARTWKPALKKGQSLKKLKKGEFFGYVVDAGIGSFMDVSSAKVLDKRLSDGVYFENLLEAARPVYVHTRDWADFPLDEKRKLNVVFFSSGWGDGVYPSYWGYDADGKVVYLVTDFFVVPREGMDEDDEEQG